MEEIDRRFDFLILDTAHLHPVESLNFLSVLPWLNDGAIVIMHDTTGYLGYITANKEIAPRLLISSIVADKIEVPNEISWRNISNMSAFQISQDTRKYICNVFDTLMFTWEYFPKEDIENVHKLIKKYYTKKQVEMFENAIRLNCRVERVKDMAYSIPGNTIFYGAGNYARRFLSGLIAENIDFDFEIWDKNAQQIREIFGHRVSLPDFKTRAKPGQIIVIMIENVYVAEEVRRLFELLGYIVYHYMAPLIIALDNTETQYPAITDVLTAR
jgi:hypothetical protein